MSFREMHILELELILSEEVHTIGEMVHSLKRANSRFRIEIFANNKAFIYLKPALFDFILTSGGPAVLLVKAVVDETMLHTLKPKLKIVNSRMYTVFQSVFTCFLIAISSIGLIERDYIWFFITLAQSLMFFGVLYFMFRWGAAVFVVKFIDEINFGTKINK